MFTSIISFIFTFVHVMSAQHPGQLHLKDQKLIGSCDNPYFTGFIIELDSVYETIDSSTLFDQLPRIGTIHFKNRKYIPTEFTLTKRAGFPQVMFRFKSTYLTFDKLRIEENNISFTLDDDPTVPVTDSDLVIIKLAQQLISEAKFWHKEDDRVCTDDLAKKSYSIYCALRIASLEIENNYNHRNASLQKLRHLIEDQYPNRKWNHRLMDYNNMEETSFLDIVNMLQTIEREFSEALKQKETFFK